MPSSYAAATFDSNVWYHITEGRVDNYTHTFTSSLQIIDDGSLKVYPADTQYWQLQAVGSTKGRYALRCSETSIFKQLSVCYVPDEIADGHTEPCMATSDGSEAQQWDIQDWGDKTYRFINVQNGTGFVMDVHPGNPIFMNDDESTSYSQPAQHWYMTSVKEVNDGAYSTTFTNEPSSTGASATSSGASASGSSTDSSSSGSSATSAAETSSPSSSSSSSSGLSSGAKAGIGVGVALGVVALLAAAFFLWRRRKNQAQPVASAPAEVSAEEKAVPPPVPKDELYGAYGTPPPLHEMSTETAVSPQTPANDFRAELA